MTAIRGVMAGVKAEPLNDTEDDQRCAECGFLACICFDDDDRDDEGDLADECMMGPDGYCGAAGSEWCDWECPLHNTYFGSARL